jgi:NAD(P)-dependent dehydrogenase (short-subunit alcohol dehydrogenase family)
MECTQARKERSEPTRTAATTPAPRHGKPADIGATVAFLLSDLFEWLTGQALCVDGGVTIRRRRSRLAGRSRHHPFWIEI